MFLCGNHRYKPEDTKVTDTLCSSGHSTLGPLSWAKGERDASQSQKPNQCLCVILSAPVRSTRPYSKLRKPRFRGGVFYLKSAQQKMTELEPQAPSSQLGEGLLSFLFLSSLSSVKDVGVGKDRQLLRVVVGIVQNQRSRDKQAMGDPVRIRFCPARFCPSVSQHLFLPQPLIPKDRQSSTESAV